jgi:4-amino-4-deoxy-L-arabinose transferase-like glycosyltransferase
VLSVTALDFKSVLRTDVGKIAVILGICYVGLIASLFLFGIVDPSDGYYSEASREMLERGDYSTPTLYYKPFYEKPIAIYWLVIASYKLFGVHEFAARLPSAFAAIICSLVVLKILRDLNLKRVGVLSALVLIGMPLYAIVGRLCLTDMLFSANFSIAILSLFAYSSGSKRHYLWLGYVTLAMAFLTKGPIAIVLGGLITAAYLCILASGPLRKFSVNQKDAPWWHNWWRQLWYLNPLVGILIILAINLPWYLTENIRSHGAFFQEFFIRQHLGRVTGHVNHQEPWYFYIPVLLAGTAPWQFFLSGFLAPKRQILKRYTLRADLAKLCIIWIVVVFGIFSASVAKLPTYVEPAMVPSAILVAMGMEYLIRLRRAKQLRIIAICICTLLLGSLIPLSLVHGLWNDYSDLIAIIISIVGFMAISGFLMLREVNLSRFVYTLSACYALGTTAGIATILHGYDELKSAPMRRLLVSVADTGGSIATVMHPSPAALFYSHKPIPLLGSTKDYYDYLAHSPAPHFVITPVEVAPLISVVCPGLVKIKQQGNWCLFQHL